jgi:hypothetical protein
MFVDAALPRPGFSWRESVLTVWPSRSGPGWTDTFWAGLQLCFSGQAPWPAAQRVRWPRRWLEGAYAHACVTCRVLPSLHADVSAILVGYLVWELAISTAPLVLGGGKRLFEGFEQDLDIEVLGTWSSQYATHVRYAVKRAGEESGAH